MVRPSDIYLYARAASPNTEGVEQRAQQAEEHDDAAPAEAERRDRRLLRRQSRSQSISADALCPYDLECQG